MSDIARGKGKVRSKDAVLKVVLIYAAVSVLWIFGSDTFVNMITDDKDLILELSFIKGTAFVLVTSLLLYYLVSRELNKAYDLEAQRDAAMEKIEDNVKQFDVLSDRIRNPISVLYSLTQGLDEKKKAMAKEEMAKVDTALESLDKGWIETHNLFRQWQERRR